MSLSWNVENIKDHETVCWDEEGKLRPMTETLIFGTMFVGMGSITDKNVDEFAARFRIMEKVQGPFLMKPGGKDWYVSDEDFIAHIGLYTNVTSETRPAWARRIFINKQTSVTEQIARAVRYERNRKTAAA